MDDEVEDAVGDVKYTDSQKSVATSNVYSMDFTDSSSERHNSSGRETYVIEWDDSEDSEPVPVDTSRSVIHIQPPAKPPLANENVGCEGTKKNKASSTSIGKCAIFAQEIYTQTSKTIIELAEHETAINKTANRHTLETQTSIISIIENKTMNYTIEISDGNTVFTRQESHGFDDEIPSITCNAMLNNSLEDGSSKFPISETENERSDDISENSSDDKIRNIDTDSKDNLSSAGRNEHNFENCSEFEDTISESTDIEEDSLECHKTYEYSNTYDTPKSVDTEVEELYNKLTERIEQYSSQRRYEPDRRLCGTLTPLTEESTAKRESFMDLTPTNIIDVKPDYDSDVLFTNAGIKVKVLPNDCNSGSDGFKLPPIQNQSVPNSPNLNFLFNKHLNKPGTLPCVFENQRDRVVDRWEIGNKELASGESPLISGRSGKSEHINRLVLENFQLPPIHVEGYVISEVDKTESRVSNASRTESLLGAHHSPISIKDKIKELKMTGKHSKQWNNSKYSSVSESRSCSPSSTSPEETRLCDAAERGCEALCVELLRRLRSHSWFDVTDTMADMPQALEKFWSVITEQRIADLIRQVSTHVESPRTQVARAACTTLAAILRNTNYTKKPDFHEAMTILLTKTGSFSRPVRRAANVALDDVVCAVELSQAITAVCVHGVGHKSPLVRCASARLLVVCCALGGGGRELLRARPPSAAAARRHALRALAALLDDKNSDARKYAERLYSMLRPLTNFEAYYLTDVEVEIATRQMKKYDQLLLCGPPNEGSV